MALPQQMGQTHTAPEEKYTVPPLGKSNTVRNAIVPILHTQTFFG